MVLVIFGSLPIIQDMEDVREFESKLSQAVQDKRQNLEMVYLPQMNKDLQLMVSACNTVLNALIKKSVFHNSSAHYDARIDEILPPSVEPVNNDKEKVYELGSRFGQYLAMLDYVVHYFQFSCDYLTPPRIAKLNEMTYRRLLWEHRPLTDFWRVGKGYANKLEAHGMYTMGDVARCSIGKPGEYHNEELLYKLFGVNAEILIDHAWGWEPCTIADVKAYKPENKSIVSGQVLQCPYAFDKARLVAREMADALALDLVDKGLVTNQLVLAVGYDRENLDDPSCRQSYHGPVTTDRYGRKIPKHAVGTENFPYTSSASDLLKAVTALFDRIVDKNLLIRRLSISANKLLPEADAPKEEAEQLDLFTDYADKERREQADEAAHARERKIQEAMLGIKKKYGKNAILKGMNLEEGATARERNQTIGGHHA